MQRTSLRLAAWVLVALLAPCVARADTGEDEQFTCPLCEKTYESYVQHSGTCFYKRLDFKDVGPIRSPWPIPRCTHCGFVRYLEEVEGEKRDALKAFVASDAYAPVWRQHTPYHCLGLIAEACEDWSPPRLAYVFLEATWELAPGDQRYAAYAKKAIGHYARLELPAADDESEKADEARTSYLVAQYLQVELHRRSAAFDAAKEVLARIAKLDTSEAPEWFGPTIAYQTQLVAKKDAAPRTFKDVPSDEDAEDDE